MPYFSDLLPTYIENWPERLLALSIRHVDIPLSLEEARAIGSNIRHFGRWFGNGPPQPLEGIAEKLKAALQEFPQGGFVRLGSRSGKDCDFAIASGMRVVSPRSALLMLTDGSERIAWDLRLSLQHSYCPHIFVREWHSIPLWAEFRCFMRGRRLVGVSQYDCVNLGPCPMIADHADSIFTAIKCFFEKFRAVIHLKDVVFDVFVEAATQDGAQTFDVRLLELNPYWKKTDSCLFLWDRDRESGGDFDGSFRFLGGDL